MTMSAEISNIVRQSPVGEGGPVEGRTENQHIHFVREFLSAIDATPACWTGMSGYVTVLVKLHGLDFSGTK